MIVPAINAIVYIGVLAFIRGSMGLDHREFRLR